MSTQAEARDDGVVAKVTIVPAKRTAVYDVELSSATPASRRPKMSARVNAKTITLGASSDIPKTLEAIDAIASLVAAVRDELREQGIEE